MTNDAGIVVSTVGATGATLSPDYKESIQEVVAVPVVEIEDASSSAFEEVAQFSIGSFFVSGGFWLGIERVFTEGFKDTLFLICLPTVVFGAVLAFVGYRQGARRVRRLERYLPKDNKLT